MARTYGDSVNKQFAELLYNGRGVVLGSGRGTSVDEDHVRTCYRSGDGFGQESQVIRDYWVDNGGSAPFGYLAREHERVVLDKLTFFWSFSRLYEFAPGWNDGNGWAAPQMDGTVATGRNRA